MNNNICVFLAAVSTVSSAAAADVFLSGLPNLCGPAGSAATTAFRVGGVWWIREAGWDAVGEGRSWDSRREATPAEVPLLEEAARTRGLPMTPERRARWEASRPTTKTTNTPGGVSLLASGMPEGRRFASPPVCATARRIWRAPWPADVLWATDRALARIEYATRPVRVKRGKRRRHH